MPFGFNWVNKLNWLLSGSHHRSDINNEFSVLFIERDFIDSFKKVLKVILDCMRVRSNRQDFQQDIIRAEVESWEDVSLLLQVIFKSSLA